VSAAPATGARLGVLQLGCSPLRHDAQPQ